MALCIHIVKIKLNASMDTRNMVYQFNNRAIENNIISSSV